MNTVSNIRGIITNIQRCSLNDGPGIRTSVFLKGCPLSCLWCHNPETQSFSPEILYDAKKCIRCGACADVCPSCHSVSDGIHIYSRENCNICGKCADACPTRALEMCGKEMSVSEVLEIVLADFPFYKSQGGMTISGGEPFAQGEFTLSLLKEAKARAIHCAVETCGAVPPEYLLRAVEYTDLFLYDVKETSPDLHEEFTGSDNVLILSNLVKLSDAGANIILRAPIIPGANDREEHFKNIGMLAEQHHGVKSVEVMAYHRAGNGKYEECGRIAHEYKVPDKEMCGYYIESIKKNTTKNVKLG